MPGYDTDCNGAKVGSILGVRCGASAIPAHWTDPLNDRVRTIVSCVQECSISSLVERTVRLAVKHIAGPAEGETPQPLTWGVG